MLSRREYECDRDHLCSTICAYSPHWCWLSLSETNYTIPCPSDSFLGSPQKLTLITVIRTRQPEVERLIKKNLSRTTSVGVADFLSAESVWCVDLWGTMCQGKPSAMHTSLLLHRMNSTSVVYGASVAHILYLGLCIVLYVISILQVCQTVEVCPGSAQIYR